MLCRILKQSAAGHRRDQLASNAETDRCCTASALLRKLDNDAHDQEDRAAISLKFLMVI